MTMPLSDEQLSRELAALKDSVVDFRNEMRAAMAGFVRQDVYQAQQETLRAQVAKEIGDLRAQVSSMQGVVQSFEADKRQNRGLMLGAFASAAVALIMSFVTISR